MLSEKLPIHFSFSPTARQRVGEIVAAASVSAATPLVSLYLGTTYLDSGDLVETVHITIDPFSQNEDCRALATPLDGFLILHFGKHHDRLKGKVIDHVDADSFFLRDPESCWDNRFGALGGSDWPRWVARGARLGASGPQIRWPGMVPLTAVPDTGHANSMIGKPGGVPAAQRLHATVSEGARAALAACCAAVPGNALSGIVRLDAGIGFWLDGALCREVAVVFLRPEDAHPAGVGRPVTGLSLVFSQTPPDRWEDGVLDYVPALGFLLRITTGPLGRGAGNDNG